MAPTQNEFTALILLSSAEQPGLEESFKAVLEPFALKVIETQRIALKGRLILGVLISCDPAHIFAIEEDINAFGESSGVDIAIDYSQSEFN